MSLYKSYMEERTNAFVIENDKGFVTYSISGDGIYIEEIFVLSDFRKSGVASEFADQISEIARKKGFKKIYGSVTPNAKNSTESIKALLAYGFHLISATNNFIVLSKGIV